MENQRGSLYVSCAKEKLLAKMSRRSRINLSLDVNYLKGKIASVDFNPWIGDYRPWVSKDIHFPYSYLKDLRKIAKKYKCYVKFDSTIEYSCFSRNIKSIESPTKLYDTIWILFDIFTNGYPNLVENAHSFSHELAHSIQWRESGMCHYRDMRSFKDVLKFELSAERLGYFIFKEYFGHLFLVHHSKFSNYRNKKHRQFLADFYKNENFADVNKTVENGKFIFDK